MARYVSSSSNGTWEQLDNPRFTSNIKIQNGRLLKRIQEVFDFGHPDDISAVTSYTTGQTVSSPISVTNVNGADLFADTGHIGEEWVYSGENHHVSLVMSLDIPEGTYDATLEYATHFDYSRSDNEQVGWINGNRFIYDSESSGGAQGGETGTWTGQVTGGTVDLEIYALCGTNTGDVRVGFRSLSIDEV